MPGAYTITTRVDGETVTAAKYNADHQSHIDHLEPVYVDDYSVNLSQMRSQVSPGGVGSESLATTLAGEIERLRYAILQAKQAISSNVAYWYGTAYGLDWFNVKNYGAVGNGVTNDASAINTTITAAITNGGIVYFPAGVYVVNSEILVPHVTATSERGVILKGAGPGASKLYAGTNGQNIIHFASSYGGVVDLGLYGNSHTSVSGLRVTPADETQTSTRVDQNYNLFMNLHIESCAEGMVFMAGPDVAGADSGCWYNNSYRIHIQYCTRGIWLKDGPNASSSGCNGNIFRSIRIGESGTNTGIQIDAADTCRFVNVDCEGISSGSSPNATPTGIIINSAGTHSGDNNHNAFNNCRFEAVTRSFVNNNSYTEFVECRFDSASVNNSFSASAQLPLLMLGGSHPSSQPWRIGQLSYQGNSQFGSLLPSENNTWQFAAPIVLRGWTLYDDTTPNNTTGGSSAGKWQTYTLTTGNMSNVATISVQISKRQQLGGFVDWHFRVQFKATVAGADVDVQFPIDPDSDMYRINTTQMYWPVTVHNGATTSLAIAQMVNSVTPFALRFSAPAGAWDTGGNNNLILAMVRYVAETY